MERTSSAEYLADKSPSQEYNGQTLPMKLDLESVDDFEHITKENSPSKEATANFLQHETAYASNQNREKGHYEADDISISSEANEDDSQGSAPALPSDCWAIEPSSVTEKTDNLLDLVTPADSSDMINSAFGEDDIGTSKNFMQYERTHDTNKENVSPTPSGEAISDDVGKLIDVDSSTAEFDNSPVKPGEFVLPNNSEIIMQEPVSDSKNSQSLPGFVKNEVEDDVHSEKIPQGDGLHLKQTAQTAVSDASDIEENVPEPLPKDYPEQMYDYPDMDFDYWLRRDWLHPKVESLIYWRDVKKSAITFVAGLAILVSLCYCSVISVVAYTSLIIFFASLSLKVFQNLERAVHRSGEFNPLKKNLEKILSHWIVVEIFKTLADFLDVSLPLNEEKTREFIERFVENLNNILMDLRRRILFEDVIESVKLGMILVTLTYIGAWFNGFSLVFAAYVAMFTLPKLYENNQTEIDSHLDQISQKLNFILERAMAVFPKLSRDEPKTKNE